MSEIEEKWVCGECAQLHDDEDEAIECCRPCVTHIFICPECGEHCDTEDKARECCATDGERATPLQYRIPKDITDPKQYIAKFCEINNLTGA